MTDKAVMICGDHSTHHPSLIDVRDWNVLVTNTYADCVNLTVGKGGLADIILNDFGVAPASSVQFIWLEPATTNEMQPHDVKTHAVVHVLCEMTKKINFVYMIYIQDNYANDEFVNIKAYIIRDMSMPDTALEIVDSVHNNPHLRQV